MTQATSIGAGGGLRELPPADRGDNYLELLIDDVFKSGRPVAIGRSKDCDVQLPHPSVAPVHANLSRSNDGLLLEDLSGGMSISVNGIQIHGKASLRNGDRLSVPEFSGDAALAGGAAIILRLGSLRK